MTTARLLFAGIIFLFFSCNKEKKELLSHVPANTNIIVIADGAAISREILIDYISNMDFLRSDSSGAKMTNTGINFNSNIYFFESSPDQWAVISLLDNPEKLKEFLKKSDAELREDNNYELARFHDKNLIAGWQKDFVIFIYSVSHSSGSEQELDKLMKLNRERSVMTDTVFTRFSKKEGIFKIWWKTEALSTNEDPVSSFLAGNFSDMQSFISFGKDNIILKQELLLTEASQRKFEGAGYKFTGNNKRPADDSSLFCLQFNYEGPFLRSFLDDSLLNKAEDAGKLLNLSRKDLHSLLSGDLAVSYNGLKKHFNEVISYQYDDNFNRVEVKTVSTEIFPEFSILLKNNRGSDSVINSLIQKKVLRRQGKIFISEVFLNNRIYLKKEKDYFLLSNNPELRENIPGSGLKTESPVEVFLNMERLIAKDSAFYSFPEEYSGLIRLVKTASMEISYPDHGCIKTKLQLDMRSGDKHPLIRILKSLSADDKNNKMSVQ